MAPRISTASGTDPYTQLQSAIETDFLRERRAAHVLHHLIPSSVRCGRLNLLLRHQMLLNRKSALLASTTHWKAGLDDRLSSTSGSALLLNRLPTRPAPARTGRCPHQ